MRQRTLVIAALATVGIAIAVAVPLAIAAVQGSHDLKFEYVKSGGVGAINNILTFDSRAGLISFQRNGATDGAEERHLSSMQVDEIRHVIAGSRFFAMDSIPPRTGASDYFSYSLTVTMEGVTHSISWVDEFAASKPVPEELKNIVNNMEESFAEAKS